MPKKLLVRLSTGLITLTGALLSVSWSADAHIGKITVISGPSELTIVNGATSASRQAQVRSQIFVSDKILTVSKQTATIELDDQTQLVVAPNSSLAVEAFRSGVAQTTILDQAYGIVRGWVRRHYGEYETFALKTPSSVMGVRGTKLLVEIDKNTHGTILHTLEGKVAMAGKIENLKDPSKSTLVPAGKMSQMKTGASLPEPPAPFDMTALRQKLSSISPEFESAIGADVHDPRAASSDQGFSDPTRPHPDQEQSQDDSQNQRPPKDDKDKDKDKGPKGGKKAAPSTSSSSSSSTPKK